MGSGGTSGGEGLGTVAVEEVVEPQGAPAGGARGSNRPTDEIVGCVVGMRVRTDRHTASAIGTHRVPVTKAGVGVDRPSSTAIDVFSFTQGDRSSRAVLRALLADGAEVDH